LSLLAVLDLSAVNAYVRDEVTAVAPQELVAELADQAEPGLPSVLVASETYDAVLQQLADERDEAATRRLASLVDLRQVGVANLFGGAAAVRRSGRQGVRCLARVSRRMGADAGRTRRARHLRAGSGPATSARQSDQRPWAAG
jgi:hypothetical protein